MNAWIKMLAAALLFALWGALVFTHQADPKDLVMGIQLALVGLGVFHAATNSARPVSAASAFADIAEPAAPAEPALSNAASPAPAATAVAQPAPVPTAAAPAAVQ
ncbi:hypothetical protein [Paraburkholderia acidiphila]|uniref:Uncharacterized protein n=1 Tax=Paraburkholderia acidiphila TaxID=2571747 RepID=A0A7Z2G849_9BURK|nr:hypothetical protein [Paraburkholderia acidiphila]QGZ56770.1 hypothetical protein FAZ97_17560 [Paraburkholderia acidiphila]